MSHILHLVDLLPEEQRDLVRRVLIRHTLDREMEGGSDKTDMQYNRVRSHDPTVGVWISEDGEVVPAE